MAGLLNMSSMLMCPHGGMVTIVTSNSRVMVGGDLAVMSSDTFIVAGCPFVIGPEPHPCVQIQWVQPAARSQVLSDFTLTEDSVGLCIAVDESVQGTVLIQFTQLQVAGE